MTTDAKPPILIVDDEPDVLFSLKGLLRHDFQLHTAESGDEALAILRQHPIHVIMTDQRMPGMTGTELMQHAKSEFPEAVRIVFTGYADIKAVVEAINSGGLYRYITKPWDPDDLIATLHRAAKRYEEDAAKLKFADGLQAFVDDVASVLDSAGGGSAEESTALLERGRSLAAHAKHLTTCKPADEDA